MEGIEKRLPADCLSSPGYNLVYPDIRQTISQMCDKANSMNRPGTTMSLSKDYSVAGVEIQIQMNLPYKASLMDKIGAFLKKE